MAWIIGFLSGFVSWLGHFFVKGAKKISSFLILVSVNVSVIVAFVAYIGSFVYFIYWLYRTINNLLSHLVSAKSDTILSLGFDIVKSLGIWDGFADSFTIISVGLIGLFSIIVSKLVLKSLLQLRTTVFMFIVALFKD